VDLRREHLPHALQTWRRAGAGIRRGASSTSSCSREPLLLRLPDSRANDASKPTLIAPTTSDPEDTQFRHKRTLNTYQFVNNLSWVTGPHNFKFGTNIRLGKHTDTRGSIAGFNLRRSSTSVSINTVDPSHVRHPGRHQQTFGPSDAAEQHPNSCFGRVGSFSPRGSFDRQPIRARGGPFDVERTTRRSTFFARTRGGSARIQRGPGPPLGVGSSRPETRTILFARRISGRPSVGEAPSRAR